MNHAFLCFSGTGNTRDAVEVMAASLRTKGDQCMPPLEARGRSISSNDRAALSLADHLIVVFPVYAWAPPALVLRSIRSLPHACDLRRSGDAHRTDEPMTATVVAVDGGNGGRAVVTAKRSLRRRGYRVVRTARIGYPENWSQFMNPPRPEQANSMVAEGRRHATDLADAIHHSERFEHRPTGVRAFVLSLVGGVFRWVARRLLRLLFVADSACTSCGLCVRSCPVATISLAGRKSARPRWAYNCESCNRCINICPERAINTSWFRLVSIPALILAATAGAIPLALTVFDPVGVVRAITIVGAIVAANLIVLAFAPTLHLVEHVRPLQRITYASFTRTSRRYWLTGFKAATYRPAVRKRPSRRDGSR